MAFTENEETKLKAIIAAFDNAQQVDDLPQSDMSATDFLSKSSIRSRASLSR